MSFTSIENIVNPFREELSTLINENVLVSGGAGFLGSWVCDVLLALGNKVLCVDNLSTGLTKNIDEKIKNKNFTFRNEDIVDFDINDNFDYIIHMASRASPEEYQIHPIQTLSSNSFGTKSVLEIARKSNCPILYTSTSEVYGDATVVPTPEDYWGNVNPVGIRSCYDEAKRFGEALVVAYSKEYGMNTRIIRIFNTYGPRIRADGIYARALPRFCIQALNDEDITVFGDGSQTRSFCFVTDTVMGLFFALTKDKAENEIINIGNTKEITILELANKIKKIANSKSEIIFKDLPQDDPKRRCPDISKAKSLLKWEPKIDFDEGLSHTIQWFRKNQSS